MDEYVDRHGQAHQFPDPDADTQVRADDKYVLHSWSAQQQISPVPIAAARGSWIYDYAGTGYLDLGAQLVYANLGHQHPDLVAAIQQQAGRLATIAPAMANDVRGELARRLVQAAPGEMAKVFFTNGGAEANENAVRMARQYTGRRKVMSMYRSYHGATSTAIALTGDPRRWANQHADASVVHFLGPDPYRSSFWSTSPEQEAERALAHLDEMIRYEGPDTIAALIIETVVGTNGILVPPPGYLPGVRELCDRYGIVYIADEVMAGFGRTGHLFAVDGFDVAPDLLTFAKGVNSGYVPLGGVLVSAPIAATWDEVPYPGGLTYSGHPLAVAAGVASLDIFERDGILEHVRTLADQVVAPKLAAIKANHPSVGDVRGVGLFWAIDLVKDRTTREPVVAFNGTGEPMTRFTNACRAEGVWPFVQNYRTHICPPLTITAEELGTALDVVDRALTEVDAFVG